MELTWPCTFFASGGGPIVSAEPSRGVVQQFAAGVGRQRTRVRTRSPSTPIGGAFVQWFADPRGPGRSAGWSTSPAGDLAGFALRLEPERKPAGPASAHVVAEPGRPEALVATPSSDERTEVWLVGRYGPVSTGPPVAPWSPSSAKASELKYHRPRLGGVQKVLRAAMSSSSSTMIALPTAGVTAPASLAK